ncbi:MAG: helix-turn-helix domain-containing protein [Thermoanaerobaculia bacterium]
MADSGEVGFGEELRRNRLVREVSLESIAKATKISKRYLEALEQGDFSRLPAPVFTRGFIRAYAGFLGLDPEEMVNAYLSDTVSSSPRSAFADSAPRRSRTLAVWPIAAAVVAVGILGAGFAWRAAHRAPAAAAKPSALPPVTTSPFIREVPRSASSTSATSSPPNGAASSGPLAMTVSLREDCWVEIFADDRLLFSGMLKKGEDRRFEARNNFRITLGNASAASVSVNGRDLPPLGGPGQVVRDLRIDAEHLDELVSRRS